MAEGKGPTRLAVCAGLKRSGYAVARIALVVLVQPRRIAQQLAGIAAAQPAQQRRQQPLACPCNTAAIKTSDTRGSANQPS